MQTCYGCDAEAESHPIVGVMNKGDVDPKYHKDSVVANPDGGSAFVGVAVCKPCHEDPEHRTERALKCHFFPAGAGVIRALVMAGSSTIGGAGAPEMFTTPAAAKPSRKRGK